MSEWQIALVLALGLGLVELMTGGLIFLGLAIGMAAVALLEGMTGGFSANRDIVAFALVSLLATLAMRRLFRGRGDTHGTCESDINRY